MDAGRFGDRDRTGPRRNSDQTRRGALRHSGDDALEAHQGARHGQQPRIPRQERQPQKTQIFFRFLASCGVVASSRTRPPSATPPCPETEERTRGMLDTSYGSDVEIVSSKFMEYGRVIDMLFSRRRDLSRPEKRALSDLLYRDFSIKFGCVCSVLRRSDGSNILIQHIWCYYFILELVSVKIHASKSLFVNSFSCR